ncbi:glutathione S-transferase family protein [Thiobacillus denitrificans ATCC 25259]|uniref:Glutathione S-transferase family protein n=1 Tax=Thiobacillus denitrificans (strain ATCC 25259 / T1) TaxID=292415 RepID=Q3SJZ3_THIDA|nr:glutathione S-transferase family protein [Thiobacillus denitrificans]AAZ97003.1 glutathione S-transferase family protein [Thiobacillus denitrificans ATCC 25259]
MTRPTVYHIPVCPFCQRVEILLSLKGRREDVDFRMIDITAPRPDWLLQKTRGTTALPVLETADGRVIKESLVILRYFEDIYREPQIAQTDPYRRAVENMLTTMDRDFVAAGYGWLMNQDPKQRDALRENMLKQYAQLDDFLLEHGAPGPFLFETFGWAETVFTPFFQRFWFLEYYEDFELPTASRYARVREWIDACVAHPAAQQTTREEVIKLYYDYACGAGNGALLPGRSRSSFALEPDWRARPWPPRSKYRQPAGDTELGL